MQRELTPRSLIIGTILAIAMCCSSSYIGLKMGRTISASIPAAALSVSLNRWLKGTSKLEHNMIQTIASAGEVVSAGAIFTIPAFVISGCWTTFSYLETTLIVLIGATLGIVFSGPLRYAMIVEKQLPFPEGIAAASVIEAGCSEGGGGPAGMALINGGIMSAIAACAQDLFGIATEQISMWMRVGGIVFGTSIELSPVILGAGYIVGIGVAIPILLGAILLWGIGIPLYCYKYGIPAEAHGLGAEAVAMLIWKQKLKYVGIGAMIIGGLYSTKTVASSLSSALKTVFSMSSSNSSEKDRGDIPMPYILRISLLISVPLFILFFNGLSKYGIAGGAFYTFVFPALCVVFTFGAAFIAATIASYLTGLIGSTCLPVSGVTVSAILAFSGLVMLCFGAGSSGMTDQHMMTACTITLIYACVVCLSASMGGDNMQDLKAGYILKSTPWKLQLGLAVGAVISAMIMGPILKLMHQAYGIGEPSSPGAMPLAAPQATMIATVIKAIYTGNIEWHATGIGAAIAILAIIANEAISKEGETRIPVLSVALGMYLPVAYTIPILIGAMISYFAKGNSASSHDEKNEDNLFASGIIAGHALVGVMVALILVKSGRNPFKVFVPEQAAMALGIVLFCAIGAAMYMKGASNQCKPIRDLK